MKKFLLLLMTLFCFASFAQNKSSVTIDNSQDKVRLKLLFGGLSPIAYKGDLSNRYNKWGFNTFLGIQYHKPNSKARINGQFDLNAGFVQGSNKSYSYNFDKTATPNTFFRTSFFNINYNLQLVLLKKPNYSIYLSQGIGLFRFVVKDDEFENLNNQLQTREFNENLPSVSLSLPTKIGGYYLLKRNIGIISEINWLNPNTDYLDNINLWSNNTKKDKLLNYRLGIILAI